MTKRASRTPEARRDLVEIADYISGNNVSSAMRFLDAAEETIAFLIKNSLVGEHYLSSNEAASLRLWPIHGFRNYLVVYRPTDSGIEIVRVLHGARDLESLLN